MKRRKIISPPFGDLLLHRLQFSKLEEMEFPWTLNVLLVSHIQKTILLTTTFNSKSPKESRINTEITVRGTYDFELPTGLSLY
jgi:hypothetical protein